MMAFGRQFDDETLQRLSEYLDRTLDERTRAQVEAQLARDAELRAELAALRGVDELVQRAAGALPEVDWERFRWEATRRREEFEHRRSVSRIYRLFVPLAAAAVVIFAVSATLMFQREDERSVTATKDVTRSFARVDRPGRERVTGHEDHYVEVSVDRTPPANMAPTVGPAPKGKMVFVAIGPPAQEDDQAAYADETDALF